MKKYFSRIFIYLLGIIMVSLGIVLCVKCELGVSPISSVPYVLGYMTPLTFGTLTMLFHFANSIFQYVVEKRLINIRVFLQIPIAFLFGIVIDFFKNLLSFEPEGIIVKIILMLLSIFLTALGMHFMLSMQLVQNPPDGTVNLIAKLTNKSVGTIKIMYDCGMTVLSIALSNLVLHKTIGFGVATICSAIFVGKVLNIMRAHIVLDRK